MMLFNKRCDFPHQLFRGLRFRDHAITRPEIPFQADHFSLVLELLKQFIRATRRFPHGRQLKLVHNDLCNLLIQVGFDLKKLNPQPLAGIPVFCISLRLNHDGRAITQNLGRRAFTDDFRGIVAQTDNRIRPPFPGMCE